MYCMNCGKKSGDGVEFCSHCGYDLSVSGTPIQPTPYAVQTFQQRSGPTPTIHEDLSWSFFDSDADADNKPKSTREDRRREEKPHAAKTTQKDSGSSKKKEKKHRDTKEKHHKKEKKRHKDREHQSGHGGGLSSVVRLLTGLCSIGIFFYIAFRLYQLGIFHALIADPEDLGVAQGMITAGCMLLAGLVGVSTRRSKAGGLFSALVYLFTAYMGFTGRNLPGGSMLWPVLAVLFALATLFVSFGTSKRERQPRRARAEREKGGGVWLLLVIVLVLLLAGGIAVWVVTDGLQFLREESGDEDPAEGDAGPFGFGQTFAFDGLRILFYSPLQWDVINNSYSEKNGATVFRVPMTVQNVGDEPHQLDVLGYTQHGPDGAVLDKIGSSFESDVLHGGALSPGAQQDTYMHFLFVGDGEYRVEFTSADQRAVVLLPVGDGGSGDAGGSGSEADSRPETSSPSSSGAESSSSSESASEPASSSSALEEDVTLIIPAYLVDDDLSETLTDADRAAGIQSVKLGADGSATLVITKGGRDTVRSLLQEQALLYASSLVRQDSAIRDVALSSDMTEATVTVMRDEFESGSEQALLENLFRSAGMFQVFDGKARVAMTVHLRDESGEVYRRIQYPDSL